MKTSRIRNDAGEQQCGCAFVHRAHAVQQQINYLRASRRIRLRIVRLRKIDVGEMMIDGSAFFCGKKTFGRAAQPVRSAAIHGERHLVHTLVRADKFVRALHEEVFFRDSVFADGSDRLALRPERAANGKRAGYRVAVGIGMTIHGDIARSFQHIRYLLQSFFHLSSSGRGGMSMVRRMPSIFMP